MNYTKFLLDYFDERLAHTIWLTDRDAVYADQYANLYTSFANNEITSEKTLFSFIDMVDSLVDVYDKRVKDHATWIEPKKYATNELIHGDGGNLIPESIELLQNAIVDDSGETTLISDTGKTISFGDKWYQMINSCSFKAVAVDRLTDFISKFVEADGWSKYFVGNIGKNNKRLIQEYHPMDKYNLDHNTKYAAMHLGGNTTRSVLVSVDTGTKDGRGEPNSITFLEIGAHTIIDRFIVGSYNVKRGKPITEATAEELAELLDV